MNLRQETTPMQQPETQLISGEGERAESRALLAATVAVFVLYAIALLALGTPPAASETPAQVVIWFREHGDSARLFVWAITVATLPLAIMFTLMRRLLPAPHRDVFLIGVVTYMAASALVTWTWAGLALHADQLEPPTARTVLDVAVFSGPVLTGATTTMIAPVTLLALRGRAGLPLWLGVLGVVAFAEQAVESVTIFGSTGFTQPGGAMNMQLGADLPWLGCCPSRYGEAFATARPIKPKSHRPWARCDFRLLSL